MIPSLKRVLLSILGLPEEPSEMKLFLGCIQNIELIVIDYRLIDICLYLIYIF